MILQKTQMKHISILAMLITMACMMTGCGDFFSEKPTEIQSKAILDELQQVRESPHVNNQMPEVYLLPSSRLAIKDGVKLFYFTKHHDPTRLARLANEQLGIQTTINVATNQIVAYCKNDAHADSVHRYLELTDVEPVQVNIDCLILERFGDITMDWETSIFVENLFGEEVTLGEKLGTFDDAGNLIDLDPAFPGASLREAERSNFGMDFGYWLNRGEPGHQARAIVDVLVSRGYLKILLNPQLETINGKKATVTMKDYTPIEEVKTGSGGASNVYNITKYVWVEDTLTVTPHVYSDRSIGLETEIRIGSRSKPEGVVQRSIITERAIKVAENRLEPGKSMIIGGMRKSEKLSVIRGIPFLKDIPLLGILFSSKDFEEKGTEIIFILTPSISSGSIDNKVAVEDIRDRYEDYEYKKGLAEMLTEPFSTTAYTEMIESQAAEAELERIQATLDLEQARMQAQAEKERADKAWKQAETLRQEARELQNNARKALDEAKEAADQVQQIKSQSEADQQKIQGIEQKKQEALKQVQESQKQAQEATEKSRQATQRAGQVAQQAQQAQAQMKKAQKEAEAKEAEAKEKKQKLEEQNQLKKEDQQPPPETSEPPAAP
ncbi:MAG: type II secretion system protein GspD [Planctomycetota bacterium]|jgi:Flp pilus assembly secretin CpaC